MLYSLWFSPCVSLLLCLTYGKSTNIFFSMLDWVDAETSCLTPPIQQGFLVYLALLEEDFEMAFLTHVAFCWRKGLTLTKNCLSCVFVTNSLQSLLTRVHDVIVHAHAGLDTNNEDELLKEYNCKDFAVALNFDVFNKKQMYVGVFTGKNPTSGWNCITLTFLTTFVFKFCV